MDQVFRVETLTRERVADLESIFASDPIADRCWCMWFMMRVPDFHEAGREGNRSSFLGLMDDDPRPLGVLAYERDAAVGWCAVGPRSRYVRAVKTPTLKGRDASEDDDVWLVTCLLARGAERRHGLVRALLDGAVGLARTHGATAVEGFPDAAGRSSERGARGAELAFQACGFREVRRPSPARVIMRKEL